MEISQPVPSRWPLEDVTLISLCLYNSGQTPILVLALGSAQTILKGLNWKLVHCLSIESVPTGDSKWGERVLSYVTVGSYDRELLWFTRIRLKAGLSWVEGTPTKPFTILYISISLRCFRRFCRAVHLRSSRRVVTLTSLFCWVLPFTTRNARRFAISRRSTF